MKIVAAYRNLPIKHKLHLIIMVTVSAALVLACTAALAFEKVAFREAMRDDLGVLAEIFASNSTAALSFHDSKAAEELLMGLKARRPVASAFIYSADGSVFASYRRDPAHSNSVPPFARSDRSWFEGDRL